MEYPNRFENLPMRLELFGALRFNFQLYVKIVLQLVVELVLVKGDYFLGLDF